MADSTTDSTTRRSRIAVITGIAVIVLSMASCGSSTTTSTDSSTTTGGSTTTTTQPGAPAGGNLATTLQAHTWVLDAADSTIEVPVGATIDLAFSDSATASGSSGCNAFHAPVQISGDSGLRFGDVASTAMSCEPQIMSAEEQFLTALTHIETADASDASRLVLTGGEARLTFRAQDPTADFEGTWKITSIRTANALASPVVDTEPTITFGKDNTVTVVTGCNNLGSTWKAERDGIRFTEARSTMMACKEPAGLMEQEQALADALRATRDIDLSHGMIQLIDEKGDMLVVAVQE